MAIVTTMAATAMTAMMAMATVGATKGMAMATVMAVLKGQALCDCDVMPRYVQICVLAWTLSLGSHWMVWKSYSTLLLAALAALCGYILCTTSQLLVPLVVGLGILLSNTIT